MKHNYPVYASSVRHFKTMEEKRDSWPWKKNDSVYTGGSVVQNLS